MDSGPDPRFRDLTAASLRELPENELAAAVYAHVLHHVLPDLAHEVEIVADLPRPIRAIYLTSLLDSEVLNGGFHQYFWNSSGQFALMAVEGLELLGAPKHAAVLRSAMATYESERGVLQSYRKRDTLEAFSESYEHTTLGILDEEYYDLGFDTLTDIQNRFIRAHPDQFESRGRAA